MPSLVENLERAAELNERLEANIREGHSLLKAHRNTIRDFKSEMHDIIDEYTGEKLVPKIDEFTVVIQKKLEEATNHVMAEMEKVTGPVMQSLGLLMEAKETTDQTLKTGRTPFGLPGL